MQIEQCRLCPRRCGVRRTAEAGAGACRMGADAVVARAALHMWEEPCISGTRGSGAVFFSGCSLRCVFCQNAQISASCFGVRVSAQELSDIFRRLVAQGAHNINLVTPTHFVPAILEALRLWKPPVPVVYNCGGYESVETLRALEGWVDIWLPDLKYAFSESAARYSAAPDYPEAARAALLEMARQTPECVYDGAGLMQKGMIIRHLILPGCIDNTKAVIDWVRSHFDDGQVLFSLMRQYVPCGTAAQHPEINRPLTDEEYDEAEQYLFDSGIEDGFVQEKDSASSAFIPSFQGEGVLPQ